MKRVKYCNKDDKVYTVEEQKSWTILGLQLESWVGRSIEKQMAKIANNIIVYHT